MSCKACHGRLRQIPAVYPTFWCVECGRLVHGSEEDLEVLVPQREHAWGAAADNEGACLRSDRGECAVWLAAVSANTARAVVTE
jgi:hypothetical protein